MTCTTHHRACDCREEEFKKLKAENAKLRERLNQFYVHGRAGCLNCKTGRITLYAKTGYCFECWDEEEALKVKEKG